MSNRKSIFLVGFLLLVSVITAGVNIGCENPARPNDGKKDVVVDADQFSKITSEELIDKLGEPEKVEKWNNTKGDGSKYEVNTYYYNSGKYEFLVSDDSVIRFTVYSDKAMGVSENGFKYTNEDDIFKMFGIETSSNLNKVIDNNVALRYQLVSDKVADVWIPAIEKNKTFDIIKITYDLRYFE